MNINIDIKNPWIKSIVIFLFIITSLVTVYYYITVILNSQSQQPEGQFMQPETELSQPRRQPLQQEGRPSQQREQSIQPEKQLLQPETGRQQSKQANEIKKENRLSRNKAIDYNYDPKVKIDSKELENKIK